MSMLEIEKVRDGAIIAEINEALKKVAMNIHDGGTSATAVREVNIKLAIKPALDRSSATMTAKVTEKLCPSNPTTVPLLVGASTKEGSHLREIAGDQPALFQGMPEKVNAAR